MQFQNAILTEEGVRILQSGASNNPVVFTRFLFTGSSTPLTAQTVNLPEPTWGNGHVTNYAAGENGFVLYMMATNDTDYGYAYGFGVYGYLQNEGVENEKLLIVANYAGNVTYVSEASGSYTRFHLAITVSLSMSNSVLAIAPLYNDLVSNTAFQDLLERTVTTHSAADPQIGDNQTVRGHKEFVNGIGVWDSANGWGIEITNYENNEGKAVVLLRTTNGVYYGSTIELIPKTAQNQSYTKNDIKFNANLIPYDDGLSVGAAGHQWYEINAHYVWASDTMGVTNQHASTRVMAGAVEFLNENDDSIGTIGIQNDATFRIDGNGNPVYITKLTVDGNLNVTGSFNIATLNAASATIGNISSTSISTQEVDATGIRTSSLNAASVNGNSATIGDISTTTLTAQELDTTAAEIDTLISTSARVSGLTIGGITYQQGFTHPFPAYGNLDHMPIGSLFLAYIEAPQTTIYPGEFIRNNGVTALYVAAIDASGNVDFERSQRVAIPVTPSNTFQVLNVVPTTGGVALVLRVA